MNTKMREVETEIRAAVAAAQTKMQEVETEIRAAVAAAQARGPAQALRKSEKTARESMVINMRLRDEAQAENARGVAGDRCESGNECGRLGCPECQS